MMAFILISQIIFKKGILKISTSSYFFYIICVYFFYIIVGIYYNFFINFNLIYLLYDFKLVLYFSVIYYWLKVFSNIEWSINHILYFFLFHSLGSIWDFIYVTNFGVIQRPNLISFFPVIRPLVEPSLLIIFLYCFKQYRIFILLFIIFEIISGINQSSLGSLYNFCTTLLFILVYHYNRYFNYSFLFIIIYSLILILYVFLPLIIYEYYHLVSDLKSDGIEIRKIATFNLWFNYFTNFPVIIGKGFGSSYLEIVSSQYSNIYSQGVHSLNTDYKFIMHTPIALFYKQGILGSLILIFIILKISIKLLSLNELKNDNLLKFLAITYPAILIVYIVIPGIIKLTILSAIILFISEKKLNERIV